MYVLEGSSSTRSIDLEGFLMHFALEATAALRRFSRRNVHFVREAYCMLSPAVAATLWNHLLDASTGVQPESGGCIQPSLSITRATNGRLLGYYKRLIGIVVGQ